jgi:antitoxin component YwqK of YwqJK toxin-antitoxin module
VEYYQNGQKSSQGLFVNMIKEGTWYYWDKDGNLMYQVTFKAGKKINEVKPLEQKKEKEKPKTSTGKGF